MKILIDLQPCQGESSFRGIGRYSMSLAKAIARNRKDHEIYLLLSGALYVYVLTFRKIFYEILNWVCHVNFFFTSRKSYSKTLKNLWGCAVNLGNAEENKLFVVKSDKKYFATADDIHPEIENNSLSYIVKAVMDNSTVLDVGCSYGYLGEWLAKNKNCQIYGIDIDEEALNYVKDRGYYKDVFHLDLDYPQNTKGEFERFGQLKEIFDFVICADVLEHLKDPTNTLGFISSKLKFGGQVMVSIPNIAHMDIILNLLEGRFNYSEFGILDNTHLRFFTKKSFIEWIKNANELFKEKGFRFDIGYLGGTVYISKFLEDIKTKYKDLYNIILSGNHDLEILQHIFALTKINGLANSYGLNKLLNDTDYTNVFYIISSKIISLENELANKDLFIQELNSKNVSLENELISVLMSKSWRYTKPIRKLLHKLKGSK